MKTKQLEETFCLLKPEAYILRKKTLIERRIQESGLVITERWKARLTFSDVFQIYDGWAPRIANVILFPPLFELDVYLLEGINAIKRMYNLKHQIRYEIWGWKYEKGGFLHAPDTVEEMYHHKSIIAKRKVKVLPAIYDPEQTQS